MKKLSFTSNCFAAPRRLLAALTALAALALIFPAPARAAQEERWLLVFDTSTAMNKRLTAVEQAVQTFFVSNGMGQLHGGDSMGVWTFDQQLHTGEFPLLTWPPENPAVLATNLVKFVRSRKYTGVTRFATLQPALDHLVAASERLTVVMFCDGEGEIGWTPYDDGINQTFKLGLAERKKARQPFVLVLRSQRGKFVGGTVNLPPGMLNLPTFPPLPAPVQNETVPTNPTPAVVAALPASVPALIIVGTKVSTNEADLHKAEDRHPIKTSPPPAKAPAPSTPLPAPRLTNAPVAIIETATNPPPAAQPTNPPAPVKPVPPLSAAAPVRTNPPAPVVLPPVALRVAVAPAAVVAMPTNAPLPAVTNLAAAVDPDDSLPRSLLLAGAGIFVAALALVVVFVVRRRRPQGSLITSAMIPPPTPPRK